MGFTESIGASATVGISAKAFGVTGSFSTTFSTNMEWKTTNTATSTEGTSKHTENVSAFTTAATVVVPAHKATEVKVVIQKRTADVSWHGHAVCKDKDGKTLETKFIDGMWHGAAIHMNDYVIHDVPCDNTPTNSLLATAPTSVSSSRKTSKRGRRNSAKTSRRSRNTLR